MSSEIPTTTSPTKVATAKFLLLTVIAIPYFFFVCICVFLLAVLPSASGEYNNLIAPGLLITLLGAGILTVIFLFTLKRTLTVSGMTPAVRISSTIRALLVFLPGIIMGVVTAVTINGEPALVLQIKNLDSMQEIIAPVVLTFTAEQAAETLQKRGLQVVQYEWDFNGDQQADLPPSSSPEAVQSFKKTGAYTIVAVLTLSDRSTRVVPYRFIISKATLSYDPSEIIVDEPVAFSVSHLYDETQPIDTIEWSFGDDETTRSTESSVSHTFLRTGDYTVRAVVTLLNSSQQTYTRDITVNEKPPLPFEISIETIPKKLISPAPFSVAFRAITEEPLQDIYWDFGDGIQVNDEEAKRTYPTQGDFTVTLNARSENGKRVRLTKLVRVVPELLLPDLTFSGEPALSLGKLEISGEQPVKISLTPKTINQPFVEFTWEAPDASTVASTVKKLEAIYRYPGEYTISLLAQHPEGRAKRYLIPVTVLPRSEQVVIRMSETYGEAPLVVSFDASETFIPGEEITGFEWKFGDTENEVPQQAGAVIQHTFTEPNTYTIELVTTTVTGKTFSAQKTLVVRPPTLAACFVPSRPEGAIPLGIQFNADCTVGFPVKYEWDFGDGEVSPAKNPTHVFTEPGRYEVELKVTDKYDTVNSETITIIAYEAY